MLEQDSEVRLAGTGLLLRDSNDGIEILLLRRNANLAFAGGAWVFPGGSVDRAELDSASTQERAARIATVREISEECGLEVQAKDLIHFCNWTTPEGEKRRFSTWFFVANVEDSSQKVTIDDGEIHEFRWITPQEAINLHHLGQLNLMPPTYLSIRLVSNFNSAKKACKSLNQRESFSVTPRLCQVDDKWICLYLGDAGFANTNPNLLGPQHRTTFTANGMNYIHTGEDVGIKAMDAP